MAGLGWRKFNAGEVLTANNFQSYAVDQSVQKYAGTAARGSAIGTAVSAGMVSYLTDTSSIEVYTGSAWNQVSQNNSPNYLINGGMEIWQRGTSSTGSSGTAFCADRWSQFRASGAAGITVTRQTASLTGFDYCSRVQRDSGNALTNAFYFAQNLEIQSSTPLLGKTVTLSFYARAGANYSAASSILRATIETRSGTEASYWNVGDGAGTTIQATTNATLTTTWTRFTVTASIPTSATQVFPAFKFVPVGTAGANDYFEITGIQLEDGAIATPFRRNANSLQGELAACQRYFENFSARKLNNEGYAPGTGYGYYRSIGWAVEKRVAPTVTLPTPTSKATSNEGSNAFIDGYQYQYASNASGNFYMLWNVGLIGTASAEL